MRSRLTQITRLDFGRWWRHLISSDLPRLKSGERGFTLVEVLIVIALIGILGSLMFGNFLKSQRRGFDAQRQGDLKTIQNAFEQYYVANGEYPIDDGQGGSEFPGDRLPQDPRGGTYPIQYSGGAGYCVCVTLEEANGNASQPDCSDFTPGEYFCVMNLQ